MRILIYKRTHCGDPDPSTGVFGNNNCMGRVRARQFDAVIGIGGIGPEPKSHNIDGKVTWVGIGPHKVFDDAENPNCPRVTFDKFWYRGENGPLLVEKYPALASRMYDRNVRVLMHDLPLPKAKTVTGGLDRDVSEILRLAKSAPSSAPLSKLISKSAICRPRRPTRC